MAEKPDLQEFEVVRRKTSSDCSEVELNYRSRTKSEKGKEDSQKKLGTEDFQNFASETTAALVEELKYLGEDVTEYEGEKELGVPATIMSLMGHLRKAAKEKAPAQLTSLKEHQTKAQLAEISQPEKSSAHDLKIQIGKDKDKKALQTELETEKQMSKEEKLIQARNVLKNLKGRLEAVDEKDVMTTEDSATVLKKEKLAGQLVAETRDYRKLCEELDRTQKDVEGKSKSRALPQVLSAAGEALLLQLQRNTMKIEQAGTEILPQGTQTGGKETITGVPNSEEKLAEKIATEIGLDQTQPNLDEFIEEQVRNGYEHKEQAENVKTDISFVAGKLKEKEHEMMSLRQAVKTLRKRIHASLNRELDVENGYVDARAEKKRLEDQLEGRNKEYMRLQEETEKMKKDLQKLKECINSKLPAKDSAETLPDSQNLIEGFAKTNEKLDVLQEIMQKIQREVGTVVEYMVESDEQEAELKTAFDGAMAALQSAKQEFARKQEEIRQQVADKDLEFENVQLESSSLQEELEMAQQGIKLTNDRYREVSEELQKVHNERHKLSVELEGRKLRAEQEREILKQHRNMLARQVRLMQKKEHLPTCFIEEEFAEEESRNSPSEWDAVRFQSCNPLSMNASAEKFHWADEEKVEHFLTASGGHIDSFQSETSPNQKVKTETTDELEEIKKQLEMTIAHNKQLKKQVEMLKEMLMTEGVDCNLAAPQLLDIVNEMRKTLENFIKLLEKSPPVAVFCHITNPVQKDSSRESTSQDK